MDTLTYNNPRMEATIHNWPIGGQRRGIATFAVETDQKRGQRATRTISEMGKPFAPKRDTYNMRTRIVDGSDGKTYVIGLSMFGFVNVMRGDLKIQQETVWPKDERWADLVAMLDYPTDEIERLRKRLAD